MDWRVYKRGLDLIRKMPSPVYFEYIRSSCKTCNLPEGEQIGFLAQQVEAIVPEMIEPAAQWGQPDAKAINYVPLLLMCYNAIRELDKRVRALEARHGNQGDTAAGVETDHD